MDINMDALSDRQKSWQLTISLMSIFAGNLS